MKVDVIYLCSLLFLVNLPVSQEWLCTGHMLVSKIAELDLRSKDPGAFEFILSLNKVLNKNKDEFFSDAACWADELRKNKFDKRKLWHFTNNKIDYDQASGGVNTMLLRHEERRSYMHDSNNVLEDCENCSRSILNVLMRNLTIWSNGEIKAVKAPLSNKEAILNTKAADLRFLIHIVGDVHQPLHSAQLKNKKFPFTDFGGNLFKIRYQRADVSYHNLHKFYDSIVDYLPDLHNPLTEADNKQLKSIASKLLKKYSDDESTQEQEEDVLNERTTDKWILESYHIAKDFIYKNVELNKEIPEAFRLLSLQILKKRLVEGGKRLSQCLMKIYETYKESLKHFDGEEVTRAKHKFEHELHAEDKFKQEIKSEQVGDDYYNNNHRDPSKIDLAETQTQGKIPIPYPFSSDKAVFLSKKRRDRSLLGEF